MLHVWIMPQSLRVHTVKMVVSQNGELEFAEWITGENGTFSHRDLKLSAENVAALNQRLQLLDTAERSVNFDSIDCDYGEYERAERKLLRFWACGEERGMFLPTASFYSDHLISNSLQEQYEAAFNSVLSLLPTHWITS